MTALGDRGNPSSAEIPRQHDGPTTRAARPGRAGDAWAAPVLIGRPGGTSERLAARFGGASPVLVFFAIVIVGTLLLAGVTMLLGLLVTEVLLTSAGLGGPDRDAVNSLVREREGTLTTLSEIGSTAGGAPVLPIIVGLVAIAFAFLRRWAIAAFAVFVLVAESATYRLTTLVIHRDRPDVRRLEDLPVDASFPSGHTAAAIAVYCGLVLLLTSRVTDSTRKAIAWTLAIVMVTFVAVSRMYRGMHHPLDVLGGIAVGTGAILLLLLACRAAIAAAAARAEKATS